VSIILHAVSSEARAEAMIKASLQARRQAASSAGEEMSFFIFLFSLFQGGNCPMFLCSQSTSL
jgi:hypothetical protein